MNVLLFDDDKVSLQKLEQKIVKYNCTIFAYQSVDEFINSNVIFDIAFLDPPYASELLNEAVFNLLKL